jgi:hypothetical protein
LIKLQRAPQKSSSTFAAIHHPGFVQPFGWFPDAVNGGAVIGFGSFTKVIADLRRLHVTHCGFLISHFERQVL